ncbi:putative arylsulfatase regulatory protein [Vibrio astriarenae]|nr:putative arylsulfatase regulatory protein [Vibrio sp. C7]
MVQVNQCHVMAKPSGSVCNIDCEYCFYLEKEQLYPDRQSNWRMSDETLERFIKQYIQAQSGPTVEFAWQGGEPTMLGLEFYQRVVELCAKYANGKQIYQRLSNQWSTH